jgi:hypothetical protein
VADNAELLRTKLYPSFQIFDDEIFPVNEDALHEDSGPDSGTEEQSPVEGNEEVI